MEGLRVGHVTQEARGTGISVFLFDQPATGAYCLCGLAPASHELAALDLDANVTHVDGLVFTGGSVMGLPAVGGALRWLSEQGRGWHVPHGVVPIVPAAAIYDLAMKQPLPPTEEDAYQACVSASAGNIASGRIGAGTGATVGKLYHDTIRMSGGIGYAEIHLPHDVVVAAYVVVNSVGDIRDLRGNIIAGAQFENGEFADSQHLLLSGHPEQNKISSNTTLAAVFTNAKFSKVELKRIAKMAVAGTARAISPIFTRYDGDMVFCFSVGEKVGSQVMIGTAAASVVQQAIINAVKDSVVIKG